MFGPKSGHPEFRDYAITCADRSAFRTIAAGSVLTRNSQPSTRFICLTAEWIESEMRGIWVAGLAVSTAVPRAAFGREARLFRYVEDAPRGFLVPVPTAFPLVFLPAYGTKPEDGLYRVAPGDVVMRGQEVLVFGEPVYDAGRVVIARGRTFRPAYPDYFMGDKSYDARELGGDFWSVRYPKGYKYLPQHARLIELWGRLVSKGLLVEGVPIPGLEDVSDKLARGREPGVDYGYARLGDCLVHRGTALLSSKPNAKPDACPLCKAIGEKLISEGVGRPTEGDTGDNSPQVTLQGSEKFAAAQQRDPT